MTHVKHENLGDPEQQYAGAFDAVSEQLLLIRGIHATGDDDSFAETQQLPVVGVETKVTVKSPHSRAWTVELEPIAGDSAVTKFSYDPSQDLVVAEFPGQEATALTRDVDGAGTLGSLHRILFDFQDYMG